MMVILTGEEFEELVADADDADALAEANDGLVKANDKLEAMLQAREAEIEQLKAQLAAAGQFAAQQTRHQRSLYDQGAILRGVGWYNPFSVYNGFAQAQSNS